MSYVQPSLGSHQEDRVQVFSQWPAEAGTWQTVDMMKRIAQEAAFHPWIRDRAVQVTSHCGRDQKCQCRALYGYVKSVMPYVRDPAGGEALHHPVTWVERRLRAGQAIYGDCDDASLYLASLLKAVGHRPAFRVMGQRSRLHHVAVVCHNMLLDTTVPPGGQYPQPQRALRVPI